MFSTRFFLLGICRVISSFVETTLNVEHMGVSMTDKKRNNQVEIPSVVLSSDDLKSRSAQMGRVTQTPAEKTASPFVIILIAVLFAAVAFLYYRLHLQQQAFDAAQAHFEQSLTQVSKLENQDQNLIEAGSNLNKQLSGFETEIRKLWDISNQLRKNDLPAYKKLLDEQQTKMDLALAQFEKIKPEIATSQKSLEQLEKKYASLVDSIKAFDDLEEKTAQLDKTVSALAAKNTGKELSSLTKRVDEIELSIAAIDAHRSQVNRNLDKLAQELKRIKAQEPTAP